MKSYELNSALATPLEKLTAAMRDLARELRLEMDEATAGDPASMLPARLEPGIKESKRAPFFG